jgi:hypothetical protein
VICRMGESPATVTRILMNGLSPAVRSDLPDDSEMTMPPSNTKKAGPAGGRYNNSLWSNDSNTNLHFCHVATEGAPKSSSLRIIQSHPPLAAKI